MDPGNEFFDGNSTTGKFFNNNTFPEKKKKKSDFFGGIENSNSVGKSLPPYKKKQPMKS